MVKPADQPPANLAELHERLGWVPLHRIRMDPPPGTATEADLRRVTEAADGVLCELVNGVLVEKPVGTAESMLAGIIIGRLLAFVEPDDLGVVLGEQGGLKMFRGNIRYPDVTFVSWEAIGSDELPGEAIWDVPPTLVVEVLSPSNTPAEIALKLGEFFASGCKTAWVIDRQTQSAVIYASPTESRRIGPGDVLDGGTALPGFKLPLSELLVTKRRKKGPPQ